MIVGALVSSHCILIYLMEQRRYIPPFLFLMSGCATIAKDCRGIDLVRDEKQLEIQHKVKRKPYPQGWSG